MKKQMIYRIKGSKIYQGLKVIYHRIRNFVLDRRATCRLKQYQPKHREHIRVGFIVQDPNVWGKNRSIYEEMMQNDKFYPIIICLPDPYDQDTGSTFEIFKGMGYECFDAREGNGPWDVRNNIGEWKSLEALDFDYLIYGHPYNGYMPKAYRSSETSKFTRIIISSYGSVIAKEFLKIRPRDFFRDVYCCYAHMEEERQYNYMQFKANHDAGLQYTKFLGSPDLEDFYNKRMNSDDVWGETKNNFKVIWTPRWTVDEKVGGSNFFRYNGFLMDYAMKHRHIDFVFRPHPMAFDNFISLGLMSEQDVSAYKLRCEEESNVVLDNSKDYVATFWKSSVLVTDMSTIIVEYFITGKPIVFCETEHQEIHFLKYFEEMLKCCYVVKNENELNDILDSLANGDDPKREQRLDTMQKIFGDSYKSATKRIIEDIVQDYTI